MLLWAKITSIRRTESETQKLVVCSLIAAPNGSILGTLLQRVLLEYQRAFYSLMHLSS